MAPTTRSRGLEDVDVGNVNGRRGSKVGGKNQRAPMGRDKQPMTNQPLEEQEHEEPTTPQRSPCPLAPRRSPRLKGKPLGAARECMKTPESLNCRPKKKLLDSVTEENDDPTYEPEVQEKVFHESKEGEEDESAINNLPYVEVNLPDGRVARQCRVSETRPKRWAFIINRTRMIEHLKSHGVDIDIPHRRQGRPTASEARIRMAPLPNPDIRSWHLQVKRFAQKDRKFNENCKRYKRIQRIKAAQAWESKLPTLRIGSREDFILAFVEKEMATYLATKAERLNAIQKRIDMGYDNNRRLKYALAWLEDAMDDYHNEDPFEGLEGMVKDPRDMPSTSNVPIVSHEDDEEPKLSKDSLNGIGHKVMPGSSNLSTASYEDDEAQKLRIDPLHKTGHEVMPRSSNLPTVSHEEIVPAKSRAKLLNRRGKKHCDPKQVQICSSPEGNAETKCCKIVFFISNGRVRVEVVGDVISPTKSTTLHQATLLYIGSSLTYL